MTRHNGPGRRQFHERVYGEVAGIPPGKVCTYGRIAELAGYPGAARQVGQAMSLVPGERGLPCHRVVNRKGELSPDHVFGGKEIQKEMLQAEGVTFRSDGRIDMRRHLWPEMSPSRLKER